jgi:hypothetical protein
MSSISIIYNATTLCRLPYTLVRIYFKAISNADSWAARVQLNVGLSCMMVQ